MIVWEFTFWICLSLVAYGYVVYPLLLTLYARCSTDPRMDTDTDKVSVEEWPFVSLVIAAYREESVILDRLKNAVLLDYPADRIEVLVGCDGEEDLTGELVATFGDSRVRLVQFPQRRGKASVLNDVIPMAKGEIIILSDANTMMASDSAKLMVRHFQNPAVGGVVGKLVLKDAQTGDNVDGVYWRYENYLKKCEGRIGALLGANGAIYAIRKSLYAAIPTNTIIDDFLIGMRVHLYGFRLLYEQRAKAFEETAPSIQGEFHRRTRIGAGGFQSLMWLTGLLNPLRGRIAFTFWSHKVCRWLTPIFLVGVLASNVVLAGNMFYRQALVVHLLFYTVAVWGLWFVPPGRMKRLAKVPAMFVCMNAALFVGFWRWISGQQGGMWKRTERAQIIDDSPQKSTEAIESETQASREESAV